ncbi:MAG: sugar ABC transporter permease, partial [Chloroflexota bacterium]|nr:sugar ABC transporter permease [Chloroflexota bacterium]
MATITQPLPATAPAQRDIPRKFLSAPTLFFIVIVTQTPFLLTLYYSFQNWNLLQPANLRWIGFANYLRPFQNPNFLRILWNSLVLSVSVVAITFAFGMILALLLN